MRGSPGLPRWYQQRAGMSLDSTEHSPCLPATHTYRHQLPSAAQPEEQPQLLLESMRLFPVPASRDFHPFKREAGLAITAEHPPGEWSRWFSSTVKSSPAVPITVALGCAGIRCFILGYFQRPRWAGTPALHNAPPCSSPAPAAAGAPEEGHGPLGTLCPHSNTPAPTSTGLTAPGDNAAPPRATAAAPAGKAGIITTPSLALQQSRKPPVPSFSFLSC